MGISWTTETGTLHLLTWYILKANQSKKSCTNERRRWSRRRKRIRRK